nr:MAG TPA: hypothetical protein [Bacteriophage sp.]
MLLPICSRLFPKFFLDIQPVLLYNGNNGLKLISERFLETVSETKKGPRMGPNMGSKF